MTNKRCFGRCVRSLVVVCVVVVSSHLIGTTWAQSTAVSPDRRLSDSSLTLAPKDAAFYSASFNMREAWEEFAQGALVTRLRQVPFVQKLQTEFETQWENPQGPLAEAKKRLKDPMVRALLRIVTDMSSHEVFLYGDSGWTAFMERLLQFNNDMYAAAADGPEAIRAFMEDLDETYIKATHIPKTVLGFRLTDDESVKSQLYALEAILRLAGQAPELQSLMQRLKSAEVGDTQTLSFTLDAELIPMDQVQEEFRGILEKVKQALGDRKLTISAGVKNKVLFFTLGEGGPFIQAIGTNENLLAHARINTLLDSPPSKIRSVSFTSKDWRQSVWRANFDSYFSHIANQFIGAATQEVESPEELAEWKEAMLEDAQAMDDQLRLMAPKFEDTLSWSFSSEVGLEGMTYDWTRNDFLENAKPMNIARHAGTSPLLLIALKRKAIPAVEALVRLALERMPEHIESFVDLVEEDEEQQEKVAEWIESGWPLLEEGADVIFEEILPALDERESLLALSALWSTTEISEDLLPSEMPLPLPELAVAMKVRDRNQFLAGCQALYDVFDKAVEVVREIEPDSVPADYSVPRPQQESISGAERFYYPEFFQAVPIAGFEPQVVVSKDVVVVGYTSRQVRDMLESKPMATRPAWLEQDAAVAGISVLDWAGMVEAVLPWIRYAILTQIEDLETPLAVDNGPVPTGNDVLQIWKCLTSLGKSATTTVIDATGTSVTRWAWVGE